MPCAPRSCWSSRSAWSSSPASTRPPRPSSTGTPGCILTLSGVATSVSWIAYFKALELGSATPVTAIDKASLVVTWLLSVAFLGEAIGWRAGLGVGMVCVGAFLMSGQK